MAKLQSGDLTLEVKFASFKDDWVEYEILFYWKNDIIINDSILKRTGEWWSKRNYGTFLVSDYEKDHLIDMIKKVLDSNKSEYWESIDPDAIIAIYPGTLFPFLTSHWTLVDENNEKVENEKYEDLFTIITFIDSYNFKYCDSYSGEGISLHIIVTKKDLEKFVADLVVEYDGLMGDLKGDLN